MHQVLTAVEFSCIANIFYNEPELLFPFRREKLIKGSWLVWSGKASLWGMEWVVGNSRIRVWGNKVASYQGPNARRRDSTEAYM